MENWFSEGQLHNIDSVVIVLEAVKCIAGCVIMFVYRMLKVLSLILLRSIIHYDLKEQFISCAYLDDETTVRELFITFLCDSM
jgi:hypothetical protein